MRNSTRHLTPVVRRPLLTALRRRLAAGGCSRWRAWARRLSAARRHWPAGLPAAAMMLARIPSGAPVVQDLRRTLIAAPRVNLSIMPTWQFFLRSSGDRSSNTSAPRPGSRAVPLTVRRELSLAGSPRQGRGLDPRDFAPHLEVAWPTPLMRTIERVRPVSNRAASTTASGIPQQLRLRLPPARRSTGTTAIDRQHSTGVAADGFTAAQSDPSRRIVPMFRRVEYAAPRQTTAVATPGRAAAAVRPEPAAPRVESPPTGVAPRGQRISADMLLSPATVGLLTDQVMRQLDRRVVSARERLGNS